jgi:Sodium Bile acid symporter family
VQQGIPQLILLAVLALMVYTVSFELRVADFRYVAQHPIAVGIGLLAQFVLLPAATWALTMVLDLPPATEAAMMLVAACPGGALSNVITAFGRGNLALSLSISLGALDRRQTRRAGAEPGPAAGDPDERCDADDTLRARSGGAHPQAAGAHWGRRAGADLETERPGYGGGSPSSGNALNMPG